MRRLCCLICIACTQIAFADDLDALNLADQASSKVEVVKAWQVALELSRGHNSNSDGSSEKNARLSLDFQLDTALTPSLRLLAANRFDHKYSDGETGHENLHTLKELYLSWQANPAQSVDIGQINARYGVGFGYNPSDFFRSRAVRSYISLDPSSIKKNRLGSVMLRYQHLWQGGSVAAMYSPKLSSAEAVPDFIGTNQQHRYLIALSSKLSAGVEPQWLVKGEAGKSVQLGFNLAMLANDATVVYLEWSGGRSATLLARAQARNQPSAFHHAAAVGFTYTTSQKLSVTAEYQLNTAALNKADWAALPQQGLVNYLQYRRYLQAEQEMPSRDALFFFLAWQDAIKNGTDINAMLRHNLADHSRQLWIEARYHWAEYDAALQWQRNSGSRASEYGAMVQKSGWQVLLKRYF